MFTAALKLFNDAALSMSLPDILLIAVIGQHPGRSECLFGGKSLGGVALEQAFHEIGGQTVHFEALPVYFCTGDEFDGLAGVLVVEGKLASQHLVGDHSHGPEVDLLVVVRMEHLGGLVGQRAGDCPHAS